PSIAAALVVSGIAVLNAQPVMAASLFFSASGSGTLCSQANPCTLAAAVSRAFTGQVLSCADGSDSRAPPFAISLTLHCTGTTGSIENLTITSGAVVILRNITSSTGLAGVTLQNGTAILENVHITGFNNAVLAIPTAPSTLTIKNCLFDGGVTGPYLRPQSGG